MATASIVLIELNGNKLFATPTGIKVGAKGKVQPPAAFLATLSKGERRKVRQAGRAIGRHDICTPHHTERLKHAA